MKHIVIIAALLLLTGCAGHVGYPSVKPGHQILSGAGLHLPTNAGFPIGNLAQIGADYVNTPTNAVNRELGNFFNSVNIDIHEMLVKLK